MPIRALFKVSLKLKETPLFIWYLKKLISVFTPSVVASLQTISYVRIIASGITPGI